jgi:hypothetical protein
MAARRCGGAAVGGAGAGKRPRRRRAGHGRPNGGPAFIRARAACPPPIRNLLGVGNEGGRCLLAVGCVAGGALRRGAGASSEKEQDPLSVGRGVPRHVPDSSPSPRHINGRVLRDRSISVVPAQPPAGRRLADRSACRTAASYALGCGLHVELVHVGADDRGAKLVIRALFSEGAEGGSGAPALVDVDRWGPTMSALTAKSWRPEALRASSTA